MYVAATVRRVAMFAGLLVLLAGGIYQQNAQNPPAPQTPANDRDKCKLGDAAACSSYAQSLSSQCKAMLNSPEKITEMLACAQKAQCFDDRSLILTSYRQQCSASGVAGSPKCTALKAEMERVTADTCDAGKVQAIFQLKAEQDTWYKVFTWTDDYKAGDCVQKTGTLKVGSDGTLHWEALVYTNHTHSGDVWHIAFVFKDKDGVSLGGTGYYNGPRMDDNNGQPGPPRLYHFKFDGTFIPSFNDIAAVLEGGNC
jgi:Family of unknown function (DUF6294)